MFGKFSVCTFVSFSDVCHDSIHDIINSALAKLDAQGWWEVEVKFDEITNKIMYNFFRFTLFENLPQGTLIQEVKWLDSMNKAVSF